MTIPRIPGLDLPTIAGELRKGRRWSSVAGGAMLMLALKAAAPDRFDGLARAVEGYELELGLLLVGASIAASAANGRRQEAKGGNGNGGAV